MSKYWVSHITAIERTVCVEGDDAEDAEQRFRDWLSAQSRPRYYPPDLGDWEFSDATVYGETDFIDVYDEADDDEGAIDLGPFLSPGEDA